MISSKTIPPSNLPRSLDLYCANFRTSDNTIPPTAECTTCMLTSSEENFNLATIFLTSTAALICFPSICIWAIFGNSLRLYIDNTKTKKIIEYILAILLFVTASYILVK